MTNPETNPKTDGVTNVDGDRRKVLAAGLAAVPLLVTLAARPAFSQTTGYTYGSLEPIGDGGTGEDGKGKGKGKS